MQYDRLNLWRTFLSLSFSFSFCTTERSELRKRIRPVLPKRCIHVEAEEERFELCVVKRGVGIDEPYRLRMVATAVFAERLDADIRRRGRAPVRGGEHNTVREINGESTRQIHLHLLLRH